MTWFYRFWNLQENINTFYCEEFNHSNGSKVSYVWSLVLLFLIKSNTCPRRLSPGQTIATCQRNISPHCWTQHVWPPCCDVLQHVGCCWLKFKNGQIWANNTNHVATRWPNARHMLRPKILRYVALACCDRLVGALFWQNAWYRQPKITDIFPLK